MEIDPFAGEITYSPGTYAEVCQQQVAKIQELLAYWQAELVLADERLNNQRNPNEDPSPALPNL